MGVGNTRSIFPLPGKKLEASWKSICMALSALAGLHCMVFPSTRAEEGLSHTLYLQYHSGLWSGFVVLAHLSFWHPGGNWMSHVSQTKGCLRGNKGEGGADGRWIA